MVGCPQFKIKIKGDLKAAFKKARKAAAENRIKLEGRTKRGKISGPFLAATYTTSGNIVTVKITKKPPLYSCEDIADLAQEFFD